MFFLVWFVIVKEINFRKKGGRPSSGVDTLLTMHPVLISFGVVKVYWLGVILLLTFLISFFLMWRLFKHNLDFTRAHVTVDTYFDSVLLFFLFFSIGARTLFIIEHWGDFGKNPLLWILFIHYPGFSFLGGVVGGLLGLWIFTHAHKLKFSLFSDIAAIGLSFGLFLGRIGNFFQGDIYGKETTSALGAKMATIAGVRHPVALYESLFAFLVFIVLYLLYVNKKVSRGMVTIYFLILLGVVRFCLEFLRGDSVYVLGIPVAQILSVGLVIVGLSLILYQERGYIKSILAKYLPDARMGR